MLTELPGERGGTPHRVKGDGILRPMLGPSWSSYGPQVDCCSREDGAAHAVGLAGGRNDFRAPTIASRGP